MRNQMLVNFQCADFNVNQLVESVKSMTFMKRNAVLSHLSDEVWVNQSLNRSEPQILVISKSGQTHQVDDYLFVKHFTWDEEGTNFYGHGFEKELDEFFEEIGGVSAILYLSFDESYKSRCIKDGRDVWGDPQWQIDPAYLREQGVQVGQVILCPHELYVIDDQLLNANRTWSVDTNYDLHDYKLTSVDSMIVVVD